MILVVGSTGILGSEICRRLAASGKSVRALVRSTAASEKVESLKAMGVETVLGDLRDPASLAAACQGVEAIITTATTTISMQPGDSIPITDQQGQLDLVNAAHSAGARHFVYVSIPMSMSSSPLVTAKRTVEKALMASGMTYTILQPCVFMEVWLSPILGFDYVNGKITIYGDGHSKNSYISLGDVAQYTAECLDNPAARNAVLELGLYDYCLLDVVRIFEKVSGRTFDLQFIPVAALEAQCAAATDPLQISFAHMMLDMATGLRVNLSDASPVLKRPMLSAEDYARRVTG